MLGEVVVVGGGGRGRRRRECCVCVCARDGLVDPWAVPDSSQSKKKSHQRLRVVYMYCKYHRQSRFDSIRLGFDYITSAYPRTSFSAIKPRNGPRRGRDGKGHSQHAITTKLSDQKAFHSPFVRSSTPSQTPKFSKPYS